MDQQKEFNKIEHGLEQGMMEQESPVVGEVEEDARNEWVDKVMAEAEEAKDGEKLPEKAEDPRKELFRVRAKQLRLTRSVFNKGKIFDASPGASEFASFVREQRRDKTLVNTVESMGAERRLLTGIERFRHVPPESQHLVIFHGDVKEAFDIYESKFETNSENVEKGLRELLRLVEPGGELRIGPIRNSNKETAEQKALVALLESALGKLLGEKEMNLHQERRGHDFHIPGGDGLEQGQFVLSIKKGGKMESVAEAQAEPEGVEEKSNMDENGEEDMKEAA